MPEPTPHASSLTATVPAQAVPLLRVRALSVRTTGARPYDILCPGDLTVQSGDVLGLVGESGSGKTTLALALLGYARSGTRLARVGPHRRPGDHRGHRGRPQDLSRAAGLLRPAGPVHRDEPGAPDRRAAQ